MHVTPTAARRHRGGGVASCRTFSQAEFENPPALFYPGYFWLINDSIREKQLFSQLRDMAERGAKSVCLHPFPKEFRPSTMPSAMDPPYLSAAYFRKIRRIVAECKRLGMNYWLYDEGGWPSGGACGQVLARNPDGFVQQHIVASETGPVVAKDKPDPQRGAPYPNLLTPGVTEAFIELTHERHRKSVGRFFGDTIRFAFMDEPRVPGTYPGHLTWTDDLGDVFRKRKGYAVEPFFADLLKKPSDTERKVVTQARVDFYDVWSQLFDERFLAPIRRWCRRNHLLSGGHFGGEDEPGGNADYGYGHIMRALRGLDLPGVDVIWRQLFPAQPGGALYYDERANAIRKTGAKIGRPFTKYASSVARQAGRNYVFTETFAVYGDGVTPAQMKWVTDYQYLRGATLMIPSNILQSSRRHSMSGCRPHFGRIHPLWKYMDLYHAYTARLGYLLSRGRAVNATALYYDVRSIWAGASRREQAIRLHFALSERLLERQCEFDYIDDDVLAAGRVGNGTLTVGKMRYDTLVIPRTGWMAPEAKRNLERFRASGGRVLSEQQLAGVPRMATLAPASTDIRVTKRAWGKHTLYFLTNEAALNVRVKISVPEKEPPVLCDPVSGKFYSIPFVSGAAGTTLDWAFEPFGSALFLFGGKADAGRTVFKRSGDVLKLETGWTLRPLTQHKVGRDDYEIVRLKAKARKAAPGDWRKYLGDFFSGDAVYSIVFDPPSSGDAMLDLGSVGYACTVKLNGRMIGRKLWGPYTFDLSGCLRKGRNTLEVAVSNTLANAIADPKVLRRWSERFKPPSPYEDRQREFEKDSLSSGLIGPVKIRFGRNER